MKRRTFRLSDRVGHDLAGIRRYVAGDNPEAAERLVAEIARKVAWAAESGRSGVARDWIKQGLRVFLLGNYCIYFTIDEETLTVSRVLHGAQEDRLQGFCESGI